MRPRVWIDALVESLGNTSIRASSAIFSNPGLYVKLNVNANFLRVWDLVNRQAPDVVSDWDGGLLFPHLEIAREKRRESLPNNRAPVDEKVKLISALNVQKSIKKPTRLYNAYQAF